MGRKTKRCFISDCYVQKDKENKEVVFFSVPSLSLKAWQEVIPKCGLLPTSKLCSRHFEEADVIKGRVIQDIFYPYGRWRLKAGAIPKLLLGTSNGSRSSSANARPKSQSNVV